MKLKEIKRVLKEYNFRPSKRLGQNFLVDEGVLQRIIETANLSKDEIVLEVGPGIGNLTMELAKRVKEVIAIEKDEKMIEILRARLKRLNVRNVRTVKEDVLKFEPKTYKLKARTYKMVANIPYYLTSPLIRKFLETKNSPREMILMVQKEVAKRIVARPPDMNLLAVSVQFYAKPEIISFVSKKSFWPQPKVDSVIIKIVPCRFQVPVSCQFRERFFKIVRAGFSQPRKQVLNNFSKKLKLDKEEIKAWLLKNNIQPNQRAETLSVEDWIKLIKSFKIS